MNTKRKYPLFIIDTSREEGPFMRYVIYHYNSMRDARQALRYAWEELKEYAGANDYLTNDILSYDAGRAEIRRKH